MDHDHWMSAKEQTSNNRVEGSPTALNGYGSSNAQLQDIKEEDDGVKEDVLLPPLPCTNNQNESDPFDLSKALEIPCSMSSKDNSSFNGGNNQNNGNVLSNSNSSKENSEGNNNNSTGNAAPLASPRISLKKKFSNALLNTGESSPVPFPSESPFSDFDTGTLARPVGGFRSQSSSNATSFQHILPALNRAIDDGSADASNSSSNNTTSSEAHLAHFFDTRKPSRKSSTSSSSKSCHSDISINEKFFHRVPSHKMSLKTRSRSESNSNSNLISTSLSLECGGTTPTTVMNTPNSSSNNIYARESEGKRTPLLRRASSAIMRKNSKRNYMTAGPGAGGNSASSTPILQPSAFFELADPVQRTPPRDRIFSNSTDETDYWPSDHSLLHEDDDSMNYVTKLGRSTSRNPSIGSKVKRGFSRIISGGGSVKKAVSSTSLRSDFKFAQQQQQQQQRPQLQRSQSQQLPQYPQPQQYLQQHQHQHQQPQQAQSSENDINKGGINMPRGSLAGVLDSGVNNHTNTSSGNITPISTSTLMSPRGKYLPKKSQDPSNQYREAQQPTLGLGVDWRSGGTSIPTEKTGYLNNNFHSSVNQDSMKYDITVDLDKLTKTIPIITVTDDLRTNGCTPIQLQSNIVLDEIFTRNDAGTRSGIFKNGQNNSGSSNEFTNANDSAERPEMMSLTDYIRVLVKQQQIEDERLAIIEKNFKDSGWCSKDDLKHLRLKRVIISKKWAERISHYQSRLDS